VPAAVIFPVSSGDFHSILRQNCTEKARKSLI